MDNEAVIRELLKAKDALFAAYRSSAWWLVSDAIRNAQGRITEAIKIAETVGQPARGAES